MKPKLCPATILLATGLFLGLVLTGCEYPGILPVAVVIPTAGEKETATPKDKETAPSAKAATAEKPPAARPPAVVQPAGEAPAKAPPLPASPSTPTSPSAPPAVSPGEKAPEAVATSREATAPETPPAPPPTPVTPPAEKAPPSGTDIRVEVGLKDFVLDPDKIKAKAGKIIFVLKNGGRYTHDFRVEGKGLDDRAPKVGAGRTAPWEITLTPGEYKISCPISNHADRGMTGTLTVVP